MARVVFDPTVDIPGGAREPKHVLPVSLLRIPL